MVFSSRGSSPRLFFSDLGEELVARLGVCVWRRVDIELSIKGVG